MQIGDLQETIVSEVQVGGSECEGGIGCVRDVDS